MLLAVGLVLCGLTVAEAGGWNDTDCHWPGDVVAFGTATTHCNSCCDPNGKLVHTWTGGDRFPEVKPWWNELSVEGCPAGTPTCSTCVDRHIDAFREVLDARPADCTQCEVPNPNTWALNTGCPSSGLPFVTSCDQWCCGQWKAQNLCNLPPFGVEAVVGPCLEYQGRAEGRRRDAVCTDDGYYNDIQCGTPPPGAVIPAGYKGDMCWCTDPFYGIQNATTAVPEAQKAGLNCADTVQCTAMPASVCNGTIGSRYCRWASKVGVYGGQACLPRSQVERCSSVLEDVCAGLNKTACLHCAGKQQVLLRSVGCTSAEVEQFCSPHANQH